MADLAAFAAQLSNGEIEVIDLTSPLHAGTPILQLPPQWGQTPSCATSTSCPRPVRS